MKASQESPPSVDGKRVVLESMQWGAGGASQNWQKDMGVVRVGYTSSAWRMMEFRWRYRLFHQTFIFFIRQQVQCVSSECPVIHPCIKNYFSSKGS